MTAPAASARGARLAPTRLALWALRGSWLLVALIGGAAISAALDGRSDAVRFAGAAGAWVVWAIGALAMAVPAVSTLTVVRAVVPLSLVGVGITLASGASATEALALFVPAALASTVVASAELGRAFVQASAYGDEQRFPLRPPLGYLAAVAITWAIAAAALITAVLTWPAGAWWPATLATVVVVGAAWLLPRRWHQLSRRWLVFVPAGLVVHDPVVLADTLLVRRAQLDGVGFARMAGGAVDLTGPTPGPALEVVTRERVTAVLAPTPAAPKGRPVALDAFLVAPSRPGAALTEAGRRRLPTA